MKYHLKTILKTSNKSVWSNFFLFFDLWKYVYSEGAFNTLYIEIKHKFEKNPLDKINGTKNALFSFASSNSS